MDKPLSEFHKRSAAKNTFKSICKICDKKYSRAMNIYKDRGREYHLKREYKLSWEEYVKLWNLQDKCCSICRVSLSLLKDENAAIANVDHDHKTGRIRGLLCSGCNVGIGAFRDNPDLLLSAVSYLKNPLVTC